MECVISKRGYMPQIHSLPHSWPEIQAFGSSQLILHCLPQLDPCRSPTSPAPFHGPSRWTLHSAMSKPLQLCPDSSPVPGSHCSPSTRGCLSLQRLWGLRNRSKCCVFLGHRAHMHTMSLPACCTNPLFLRLTPLTCHLLLLLRAI